MPFACCLCCGDVVEQARGLPDYGKSAGPCPSCGRTMYSAAATIAGAAEPQADSGRSS
jgi:hypothetical protein